MVDCFDARSEQIAEAACNWKTHLSSTPATCGRLCPRACALSPCTFLNQRRYKRVLAGRSIAPGVDTAMQPVQDSELDSLELFSATEAARSVVVKMKKKAERKKERRLSTPAA